MKIIEFDPDKQYIVTLKEPVSDADFEGLTKPMRGWENVLFLNGVPVEVQEVKS